ncbi:MAG: hypothetical protein WCF03_16655 [Nitrososphaeraceae archaeon]
MKSCLDNKNNNNWIKAMDLIDYRNVCQKSDRVVLRIAERLRIIK